jgi:2-(1,2-epoxy-1,2-dihydrophenyl)acetyl-CoA isomerase
LRLTDLGSAAASAKLTLRAAEAVMAYTKIKVSEDGPVTVIAFADPATMNAAGVDTAQELTAAFDAATAEGSSTRAIVLTGEGRGFCSGANLSGGGGSASGGGDAGSSLKAVYNPLVTKVRNLTVPLVTAVNGAAAGVGCSIALMGDMIVAAESAYFLQAFRRIGLIPDGGSTYLLPRMIGRARAMEMALLGERVPAAKALEWGMINRVVPDAELMPTAMALANELARGPASLALIRQTIWDSLDTDWADQLTLEADRQSIAGRTEDFREGVSAFLQKRPAEFKGR